MYFDYFEMSRQLRKMENNKGIQARINYKAKRTKSKKKDRGKRK